MYLASKNELNWIWDTLESDFEQAPKILSSIADRIDHIHDIINSHV